MIEIDGEQGEGGGQMLRTALSLSAITQQPFRITRIRAKRANPGLQYQHLQACLSVRKVCRGELEGAELLSQELSFKPGDIVGGKYTFDIGTAGSTILVVQTLLPILLFASKKSTIHMIGGTHVMKSPSFDYFNRVFLSAARRFGMQTNATLIRSGYYPKGGGEVSISVMPSVLRGCTDWGADETPRAVIRLGSLPSHIASREKLILREGGIQKVEIYEEETLSPGNAITLSQGFRGAYVLGERGKRAEIVAKEALDELLSEQAPIDAHLADQLLLYAALSEGHSHYKTSRITDHTLTNAYVISHFLKKPIEISKSDFEISC